MRSLLTLVLPLLAPLAGAQEVRGMRLTHRDGQTFVTWRESGQSGTTYRVYRSFERIQNSNDLNRAELLGEVDGASSRNTARTQVDGADHGWVIGPDGQELSSS